MESRIELLSSSLLLICQIVGARHVENVPCRLSLTVPLEKEKVHRYENGSLLHDGILYPSHLYWTVNDTVRGCICEVRPCLRKCCQDGEVLSDGEKAECITPQKHYLLPDLRLEKDQLAPEIENIRSIGDHFALVRDNTCPNKSYKLEPEKFDEDKFVVEKNGTLRVGGNIHQQWNFCIDWHESLKKVIVVECLQPSVQTVLTAAQTIYPIMTIVSVPFLILTFLVYAIIPELRNIYGKTLMCYVACLVMAYCSLINAQYKYLPPGICVFVGTATTVNEELPIVEKKITMEDYIRYCLPEGNCLSFCCPPGYYLSKNKCLKMRNAWVPLPRVHTTDLRLTNVTTNDVNFRYLHWNPCEGGQKYPLNPSMYPDDRFYLLRNGSFYLPFTKTGNAILTPRQYCLAVIKDRIKDRISKEYLVLFCYISTDEGQERTHSMLISSLGMIVSIPFLLSTFLVYSVLDVLRNLHGFVLRGYVGSSAVAYAVLSTVQILPQDRISNTCCVFLAFVIHFSFLASFFWLNIMSFDIWWTFGGFRTLRGSKQQRDRKKFIMYSVYAWGSASLLTGTCLILDFSPIIPKNFIRPEFGAESCWFNNDTARAMYFYGPMGLIVLCNIFLFISTAIKIQKHRRDTAHHLNGSESKCHDDNKQWFNLYLKLFIVMGITWSMEIVSWLLNGTPQYLWYISDLANTLQGVIIFIIFVCKKKIKRLLLKKFRRQNKKILSRNSTRSICHSSASRTCTTSIGGVPLQEKVSAHIRREPISLSRESAEESDCA